MSMPIDLAEAIVDHFVQGKQILDLPSGGFVALDDVVVREAVRVYREAFGPRDLSMEQVAALLDTREGWRCVRCSTFVPVTSIDLDSAVCGCGLGAGRWRVSWRIADRVEGHEGAVR
jgi:hypothetical protein